MKLKIEIIFIYNFPLNNMPDKIIEGYNGIPDLDLTNVDKKYHKIMIDQHLKDIEQYKIEQEKLKPELRYENTVAKAKKRMEYYNKMQVLRLNNKI